MKELIPLVKEYVQNFLNEHLSPELKFHCLKHTCEVVEAAQEIGLHSKLSEAEMTILVISAWFHDCGYVFRYISHEEESKRIARDFLEGLDVNAEVILTVINCIGSTKFPQSPKSELENILCDADLYHFARPSYPQYAETLRKEFEVFLGKEYSEKEWSKINTSFLIEHKYWTIYGKTVLEKFKQLNIDFMIANPSRY